MSPTGPADRILALEELTRELGERATRWRAIFDAEPECVKLIAADGRLLEMNAAGLRMIEADSLDQVRQQRLDSLIVPEQRQRFRELTSRVFAGDSGTLEFEIVGLKGRRRWMSTHATPLRDEHGRVTAMLGITRDVTDRIAAHEHIRRLNRTYAVLSAISQLIVRERDQQRLLDDACRIAVETGGFLLAWIGLAAPGSDRLRVVASSGASTETFELLRGFIEARDDASRCMYTQQALASGHAVICADIERDAAGAPWRDAALARGYRAMVSLPLLGGAAPIGTFNLYASDAGFFDQDELTLLAQLADDVSFGLEAQRREERRQEAERALRASEERFRELAETIQEVFWMTDANRQELLYVSPAYESVWGRSRQTFYEVPGSWSDAIHPADRDRVIRASVTDQVRGEYDEEYRIVRPDGEIRWIRERAFPVRSPGGVVQRIVGVARDVTDRKLIEQQMREAQKMESVGRLAAGLAHDFNNVLTVINGIAELAIAELPDGSPMCEHLQSIQAAGARAAQVTKQLLAFSRKQVLHPVVVDLNGLVREAQALLQRVLGTDIRVEVATAPGLGAVRVDPGQLHQVLLNLALNSRDAMPRGGTLRIDTRSLVIQHHDRAHPALPAGDYAVLAISDTGTGMDSATQQRLFEPFFTTKAPGKGTGLGLATVHGIVKQSGGEIEVDTALGRGTTFTIFLPVTEERYLVPDSPKPDAASGAECVLVVDDDAAVRGLTRRLLERAGYSVLTAGDGADALAVLAANAERVDLVLTDIVMPGMNGRELAERIWRERPQMRILFMSGYTDDAIGRHGVLDRHAPLVSKPFSAIELTSMVRQVLDA